MTNWIDPDREFESSGQTFFAGVALGALLVGIAWFALSVLDSPPSSGGPGSGSASAAVEPGGRASLGATTPCAAVFEAQSPALRAGRLSMVQWEVHVGAMNQLVNGAISLSQASAFWNQTRVGAQHRLDRFSSAISSYRDREARCPESRRGYEPAPPPGSCAEAVALRARTLRTADRALSVWQQHVDHMEMLRHGDMTAAQATRMWLKSWRKGADQIDVYRASAEEARGRSC